jgi:hypothetical protein
VSSVLALDVGPHFSWTGWGLIPLARCAGRAGGTGLGPVAGRGSASGSGDEIPLSLAASGVVGCFWERLNAILRRRHVGGNVRGCLPGFIKRCGFRCVGFFGVSGSALAWYAFGRCARVCLAQVAGFSRCGRKRRRSANFYGRGAGGC